MSCPFCRHCFPDAPLCAHCKQPLVEDSKRSRCTECKAVFCNECYDEYTCGCKKVFLCPVHIGQPTKCFPCFIRRFEGRYSEGTLQMMIAQYNASDPAWVNARVHPDGLPTGEAN